MGRIGQNALTGCHCFRMNVFPRDRLFNFMQAVITLIIFWLSFLSLNGVCKELINFVALFMGLLY